MYSLFSPTKIGLIKQIKKRAKTANLKNQKNDSLCDSVYYHQKKLLNALFLK